MAEIAIHNVRDLGEDARRALEALLGRQLEGFPRLSRRCPIGPTRFQTTSWNR
jgi:hypothetical protein